MNMISEPKIKHILWNHLETNGYEVGEDVTIVSGGKKRRRLYPIIDRDGTIVAAQDEDLRTIIEGEENVNRFLENGDFRPTFDNNGALVLIEKRKARKIDLVAIKDGRFIGYEAKGSFKAVSDSISTGQLETYKNSRLLDYLYIVIPIAESEHVNASYRHIFDKRGIGIIGISENGVVSELKDAKKISREGTPTIRKNEAWLVQKLWDHFESEGYDVEGKGVLPKPRKKMEKIQKTKKHPTANSFLKKIDLFLLPKGHTITDVAYNQNKLDCIGIEVKYSIKNKKNLENIINNQLNSYAESEALTKLYLAVNVISNKLLEKIKEQKDRKFGLLLYDKGNFGKILDAPKLKINYDMFAFMHPEGGEITVYELGEPNSIKTVDFPYYKYANRKDTEKFFSERLKFYKLIYASLSRREVSHVIEVISKSDKLTPNLNMDDSYEE